MKECLFIYLFRALYSQVWMMVINFQPFKYLKGLIINMYIYNISFSSSMRIETKTSFVETNTTRLKTS